MQRSTRAAALRPSGTGHAALLAACCLACGAQTFAGEPAPRLWTWNPRPDAVETDPRVIPSVRVDVTELSGAQAAGRAADLIRHRGLGPGEICLILQNYGAGDGTSSDGTVALAYHRRDALVAPILDPDHGDTDVRWRTAWMSNGINESRAWMTEFVNTYTDRQLLDPDLPSPSRFHFDTELTTAPCCGFAGLRLFDAMLSERVGNNRRATSEPIPGQNGLTLLQAYAAAGSPPYDTSVRMFDSPENRAFTRWWIPLNLQAVDAAMKASTYDVIHQRWGASVRVSDYINSCRVDGIDGRTYTELSTDRDLGDGWVWSGSSDMQAPALFPVHPSRVETESGESRWDATLRLQRANLAACIESFGGGHQHDMSPWIAIPGQIQGGYRIRSEDCRRMLAMLRAFGISEVLVWSDAEYSTPETWEILQRLVRHVWSTTLDFASITRGTRAGTQPFRAPHEEIRHTDRRALSVVSDPQRIAEIHIEGTAELAPSSCRLALLVESTTSAHGVRESIWVWNWSDARWDPALDDFEVPLSIDVPLVSANARWRFVRVDGYVRPEDHAVRIRVRHESTSNFVSHFDLVQFIGADGRLRGDVNRDEQVSYSDLSTLLDRWRQPVEPFTGGDEDGSGFIDIHDLGVMLSHWAHSIPTACAGE